MKQEILEYLVRSCVKEVLNQVQGTPVNARDFHQDSQGMWCKTCGNKGNVTKLPNGATAYSCGNTTCPSYRNLQKQGRLEEMGIDEVEDPTKGAPAPPEAGQGTADAPEIPKEPQEEPTEEPEDLPPSPELKGIKFVSPSNKAKLIDQSKNLRPGDEAALERSLFRIASTSDGPSAKVALATRRAVQDALKNPNTPLFLYLGKYDPESEEIFLLADKSLQVAKDSSISPSELTIAPVPDIPPSSQFDARGASTPELMQRQIDRGEYGAMTPRRGIDENLHKAIKRIVNEVISNP